MKVGFEYRSTLIFDRQNPVKALDDLGQKGWEAYAALRYDDNSIVHFLKRRLILEESTAELAICRAALTVMDGYDEPKN